MSNLNLIIVEGRVKNICTVKSGCKIDVQSKRKDKKEVSIFPVVVTGKLCELCMRYLSVGDPVLISGPMIFTEDTQYIEGKDVKFLPRTKKQEV
jgi:single-stranded DNA-binding protein